MTAAIPVVPLNYAGLTAAALERIIAHRLGVRLVWAALEAPRCYLDGIHTDWSENLYSYSAAETWKTELPHWARDVNDALRLGDAIGVAVSLERVYDPLYQPAGWRATLTAPAASERVAVGCYALDSHDAPARAIAIAWLLWCDTYQAIDPGAKFKITPRAIHRIITLS